MFISVTYIHPGLGVGVICNSLHVFSACRKRRLNGTALGSSDAVRVQADDPIRENGVSQNWCAHGNIHVHYIAVRKATGNHLHYSSQDTL